MRRAPICLLVLALACKKDEAPVDEDTADETDVSGTDLPDTDDDTDVTDTDAGCAWWRGADVDGDDAVELTYRVAITVTGGAKARPAAPVAADLDLAAIVARHGDARAPDPASLRLVRQACESEEAVLIPSQWVDRLRHLGARVDHLSPADDGAGTLAFLYDVDGNLETVETLQAGAQERYVAYFGVEGTGADAGAPTFTTDLTVSGTTVSTAGLEATFDPARGGTLSSLRVDGSASVTSQADACCGTSVLLGGTTWHPPAAGAATVDVLAEGPILAALRAHGERTWPATGDVQGSYAFELLWLVWAGHPAVHVDVWQAATRDTPIDRAERSFRPWQSVHRDLGTDEELTHTNALDQRWGAVAGATHGYALAAIEPADRGAGLENPQVPAAGGVREDLLVVFGHDLPQSPLPDPLIVPTGTAWFDHVQLALRPFAGAWTPAQRSAVEDLLAPPTVQVGPGSTLP